MEYMCVYTERMRPGILNEEDHGIAVWHKYVSPTFTMGYGDTTFQHRNTLE